MEDYILDEMLEDDMTIDYGDTEEGSVLSDEELQDLMDNIDEYN